MSEMERRNKSLGVVKTVATQDSESGAVAFVLLQAIGALQEHSRRLDDLEAGSSGPKKKPD
jgi:hypothetical protein